MTPQIWQIGLGVFMGTLPLLGVIIWNLLELKTFRSEVRADLLSIRGELSQIRTDITNIRERVATLEERDRLTHPPLVTQ